jgi:protocatechuate 3,4-dioxygenase, alpha subunit
MEKKLATTPSQTIGPYFAYSLTAEQYGYDYNSLLNHSLISEDCEGDRIFIVGQVFDGAGAPVNDAMIELWQCNTEGEYRLAPIRHKNDGFTGFGRLGTGTDAQNRFIFQTIKPNAPLEFGKNAPHINVILFMRGSLHHLYSRIYFSDEQEKNAQDPLLQAVAPERRNTLIAQKTIKNNQIFYTFDIKMQGEGETVFFEV